MVAGEAAGEAISLARATPTLAVGLHVVVIGERSCLPPSEIPHLVDRRGFFSDDAVRAGLRYFFSQTAQKELARELEAQFDRFASTGLPLSHVNGHAHMHMHPTVFTLILSLAEQYGASGIRLLQDDLKLALGYARQGWGTKTAWAIAFGLLCRWGSRRLRRYRLTATDRVYGLYQTGAMQEDYVVRLLRQVDVRTAELYFHPTIDPVGESLGPNSGDLAALLSPAVRQVIQERGIRLATYATLRGISEEQPRPGVSDG
jgi:hopanoid biosynthesis associated protein HpnK